MKLPKNFFNLVRVILGISLAGVVAGINLPLSTLTLKSWGITSSVIGMAASMMGLSAAVATPFLPRMVNRFGQIPVLRISVVVLPLAILALPLYQNLYAWFILRFIIGLAATNIWVLSEIWINSFDSSILKLYFIHLFFNGTWSIAFFGFHQIGLALINLVIILIYIILLMKKYLNRDKVSFYLMMPYFLWSSYALVLNSSIFILN